MISSKNIALKFVTGEEITYAQLNQAIDQKKDNLRQLPKGVLILKAASDVVFISQFLAALQLHIPVLILPATYCLTEINKVSKRIKKTIRINEQGEVTDVHEEKNGFIPHPESAIILLTSGTTGKSKLVQLSLENILANCWAVIDALEFKKVKDQLLFLPLHYSFGLLGQLLPALLLEIQTCLLKDFSEVTPFLKQNIAPQMWSGVPSHWSVLEKIFASFPNKAAQQVTHVVSAGDSLSVLLRQQLSQRFLGATLYNNYGLTEASPRVLILKSSDRQFYSDAVGYPIGDWNIKVNGEGELLIKGSQVMLGYLGQDSKKKIKAGWLHTGDIAEIKKKQLVFIKGRVDRCVQIHGEKISLEHIEKKLMSTGMELVVLTENNPIHGTCLIICVDECQLQMDKKCLQELFLAAIQPWQHGFTIKYLKNFPRHANGKINQQAIKELLSL